MHALAHTLNVDMQPRTHGQRLLLVQYFAALVIGGRLPARTHDGLGNTALHYAARVGWAAGVESIVSSRAVFDDDDDDDAAAAAAAAVVRKNSFGCSALHCAAVSGCVHTLHLLLQVPAPNFITVLL